MTFLRPLGVTLPLLFLALVGVAVVDVRLWRFFVNERDALVESASNEVARAQERARELLEARLTRELASRAADVGALEADILLDDRDVAVFQGTEQLLPRHRPLSARPAADDGTDAADGLRARAALVGSAGSDDAFAAATREFLKHRAHTRTSLAATIEASLDVADVLVRRKADRSLIRALLVEGMDVGADRIEPVARQLVEGKARHVWPDMASELGALRRFQALMAAAGLDGARVEARWQALDVDALPVGPPHDARRPAWRTDPSRKVAVWFGERQGDREVGLIVSRRMDELESALNDAMFGAEAGGAGGERISLRLDVDAVATTAVLPRQAAVAADAERALRGKTLMLAAMTVMVAAFVLGILFEVARRRRYEALRGTFIAAVSHELRTPLASMRLQVEAMLPRASDDKARERLERLVTDVDGLDFLVENILSFSRMERGRLVPRKERVSLSEVAAEAVGRARHEAPGVTVDVKAPEDVEVNADPELVGLVVHNLVRNAWQHHPGPERRVTVRVEQRGGQARVSVEDDGPGVAEADKERIFGEFERGSKATSRGTGLGLALSRQIARAHGGDVSLASTGPGGSTFVLALPLPG